MKKPFFYDITLRDGNQSLKRPWQLSEKQFVFEKLICALPKISSCSFGIYLIHRIVMYYEGAILNMNTSGHVWRIIFIPITYLVSLLVVFFLKKIPGLGKILV